MGLNLFSLKVFTLLLMVKLCKNKVYSGGIYNVKDYGAIGDGTTENSIAFLNAWKEACESGGTVLISEGTFVVNPIELKGPCQGGVNFVVNNNAVVKAAQGKTNADYWFIFENISGLTVKGNGTFDGQGNSAWPYNDCQQSASCTPLSASLVLSMVDRSLVENINLLNSKGVHMKIEECKYITVNSVTITAPDDSPNTDGIHTENVNFVTILNSNIGTGDDCISMGPGTKNINITRVNCGPGHGISIGSIGKYPNEQNVKGVMVQNCKMSSTQNGVRIKTWNSTLETYVSGVTFQDIVMNNTHNPIIIDQHYCGGHHDCIGNSHVQVKNVKFIGVRGTSSSEIAVNLDCSSSTPCKDIELDNINLSLDGGGEATSSCLYAQVIYSGKQNPTPCKHISPLAPIGQLSTSIHKGV